MAETAGLVIGAVSLATLFSTCVDCLDYVSRARNYGKDFQNVMTKFNMLEVRLKAWGKSLRVDKPGNELQALRNQWGQEQEIVGKALCRIKDIFDDRQKWEKKYGLQKEEEEEEVNVVRRRSLSNAMASLRLRGTDAELPPYAQNRQQGTDFWKKMVWAVHDSKKFDTLIDDLDFYIRNLEKLTKRLRNTEAQEVPVQVNDQMAVTSSKGLLANSKTTSKSWDGRRLHSLQDNQGSNYETRANTEFCYAYSSLRPVAKYVPRPALESKIRDQLSTKMESSDNESRTVVVCGLGGSGKSQLILNYVKQYRQEYEAIIWIEAGKRETIERDFIRLYRALFPDVARGNADASITLDDAVLGIKGWFHRLKRRSLIIIDSADCIDNEEDPSYIDLSYLLPEAPQVDIIITTRSSQAQALSLSDAVEVGQMTETEAVELLSNYAKIRAKDVETKQEIIKIVDELGYLALAITMAGSYIAATPRLASNIGLYLPEYHKHRKRLLSRKAVPNIHSYKQSVFSTWETSFEAIRRQSPIAANFLCLLAFLNFDDIFLDLFPVERDPEEWDRPKKTAYSEKIDECEQPIEIKFFPEPKHDFGSTSLSDDKEIYRSGKSFVVLNSIDFKKRSLCSDTSEVSCEEETSYRWETLISPQTEINFFSIQEGFAMLQNYSLITWHEDQKAYSMHKLVHTWGYDRLGDLERRRWSLAALHLLSETGKVYHGHTTPARLRRFLPHVVAIFTTITSNFERPYTFTRGDLRRMMNLANLCDNAGKWDFTLHMRECIACFTDEVLGIEDSLALRVKKTLADTLYYYGQFERVEALSQQILQIQERSLSADHPNILDTKNDLISTLGSLNRLGDAKELASQVLKTREILFGKEHNKTLTSKLNLAVVLSDMEQYEEAKDLFLQVLAIGKKLNSGGGIVNTCKHYLARLLKLNGRLEEAEDLLRQVVDADELSFGEEHPSTLCSKSSIAAIMRATGRLKTAEMYYSQVLVGRKKALGLRSPDTLRTTYNLALVFREQGKHDKALELAEECWRLRKDVFGAQHLITSEAAELLKTCRSSL